MLLGVKEKNIGNTDQSFSFSEGTTLIDAKKSSTEPPLKMKS